jgi:hypothetical protein
LDRHAAGQIVRRLAKGAGIDKAISPHSLRHAAITAALGAGCSLRDVQGLRTACRPTPDPPLHRARDALDRSPTYTVATYLAGATGARGEQDKQYGCRDIRRAAAVIVMLCGTVKWWHSAHRSDAASPVPKPH